jgi:triosephosphate isomerase
MRQKIVAGNWKMNKTFHEGNELALSIIEKLKMSPPGDEGVILCTPFIHLATLTELKSNDVVETGAQNCSGEESGAFTGEISASMVKSTGANYVIIGHSERRIYFNEDNLLLNKKTKIALKNDLKVIFCCGEVLSERESGNHYATVKKQLEEGLTNLREDEFRNIIIAYEPVWAIGTGVTATSEQAQEMHKFIRDFLSEHYDKSMAENISILYGGSCNPGNARELFSMPDVDGGLIGGASLKHDDFIALIESF